MPVEDASCRHLRFAPMEAEELESAVRWAIAKESNWSIDSFATAYLNVGECVESGKPRQEVLAVAAKTDLLQSALARIRGAGLNALAVDYRTCAIARCFLYGVNSKQDVLIIEANQCNPQLIVVRQGVPTFIRPLLSKAVGCRDTRPVAHSIDQSKRGSADHHKGLIDWQDTSTLQDVIHEIAISIHYLSEARPASEVPQLGCVLGADEITETIHEHLSDSKTLEYRPFLNLCAPAFAHVLQDSRLDKKFNEWLPTLGLALYEREHLLKEEPR
ncbi:MAG TPA: hypothetical protein VG711_10520 [Phycisphaerales bacterium]|nr:hypothetical protein [Phycisphaerales bacterium]